MKKVVIVTDHYFDDRRGGGISSAISNLSHNLENEINISLISYRKQSGQKQPFYYYYSLLGFLFFKNNVVVYLNGIFNLHSNIIPILLARFTKNKLILSPRGMLKSSALNESKKKLFFLKLVKFLLKKSTIIHVTDSVEERESILFFPTFQHVAILDFSPPRIKEFPMRLKHQGELSILYIGRIDELKNLHSILVTLKKMSVLNENAGLVPGKKIKFTIVGQKADTKYFECCKKLIDEINNLNEVSVSHFEFIPYHNLQKFFLNHHIFISLSKGENFGYTIAESLANALPIIITPNSPFGKLLNKRIGSVVQYDNLSQVFSELLYYYNMTKDDYTKLSRSIFDNYNLIFNKSDLICEYKKLFNV